MLLVVQSVPDPQYPSRILTKNKNKQEKIENLIKSNIQKCTSWCIKYAVPYNVFLIFNPSNSIGSNMNFSAELSLFNMDDIIKENIEVEENVPEII